ncbi:cytidylyltransferase domain-containing protein [Spirosoma sp. 209]|uniref:acylneuraminate cytidylyltransferase family protein n=1 Tax=Spirosoma sp. 209 TaxID=1955701 RepID=UPI00098D0DC9|nr:acylneuraminate cytidylyltransferase family protein [Spirosoma sp. 209]
MKPLFLITARGGSKGIPGKNIRPFLGKPLLYYAIDTARALAPDTDICLSTDADEIIRAAEAYGLSVPFKRPDQLATDQSGSYEVMRHAVDFYKQQHRPYDTLVLLQPTSPFRTAQHVRDAMALYAEELDMVVSVTESASNPYYNLFEERADGFLERSKTGNFSRRQDCPAVYAYNGAVYVINLASLAEKPLSEFDKVRKYVMSPHDSVDLDTPLDWAFAEFLATHRSLTANP